LEHITDIRIWKRSVTADITKEKTMNVKTIMLAGACILALTGAAAAAELGSNPNAKSQGSLIGVYSSQVTGNGAAIGGGTNGDSQTTEPGSRADEVQAILASEGRGRDK
jgi:hypothetical protein